MQNRFTPLFQREGKIYFYNDSDNQFYWEEQAAPKKVSSKIIFGSMTVGVVLGILSWKLETEILSPWYASIENFYVNSLALFIGILLSLLFLYLLEKILIRYGKRLKEEEFKLLLPDDTEFVNHLPVFKKAVVRLDFIIKFLGTDSLLCFLLFYLKPRLSTLGTALVMLVFSVIIYRYGNLRNKKKAIERIEKNPV